MSECDIGDGTCPACGRYAGNTLVCEYCDTELPAADLVRWCRQLAALSAVLGLLFLLWSSRERKVPRVSAGDIKPTMNNAIVEVTGRIASRPHVSKASDQAAYVSFLLRDDSGNIRVCLQGAGADAFCRNDAVMQEGAAIAAVGVLQVRAGREPRIFVRNRAGEPAWTLVQ